MRSTVQVGSEQRHPTWKTSALTPGPVLDTENVLLRSFHAQIFDSVGYIFYVHNRALIYDFTVKLWKGSRKAHGDRVP